MSRAATSKPCRTRHLAYVLGLCALSLGCDEVAAGSANGGAEGACIEVNAKEALDVVTDCPHPSPKVVDCSLAFADEDTYTVRVVNGAQRVESHGGLYVDLNWNEADHDTDSFSISVYTDTSRVGGALYQVSDCGPLNQFYGMHGFTGLLAYTHPDEPSTSVQLGCFVRASDDPMTGWDTAGI